ncbi:unnamed protein product [Cylicostephanus goldi]|uniref:Uncharacterized protein n=1 Tax=Cylicostephanus goldi TaxID=71465 RepID=A0A3P7PQA8_CYLGO|nr:unnamed protein product [Cylicostephanus goldi]
MMAFRLLSTVHPPGGNEDVFLAINKNKTRVPDDKANCLVFLSAMTNVTEYKLDPVYDYDWIVAVKLAGGDFSGLVDKKRGTVVEVSEPFYDEENKNANIIYNAIRKGFQS